MITTKDWTVLLVDDDEEFVTALGERLCMRGIQAETVFSGEEALRRISTDPPDVVVLDVVLPGIGGLEVLKRVKKEHPHIEIVLLTGRGTIQPSMENWMRLGAASCLTKPTSIEALIVEILDVLKVPKPLQTPRSETEA